MKHKLIKVIIVVAVVAIGIWLFGGCDRTPDLDNAKVDRLVAIDQYSVTDLDDVFEQLRAIGGVLSSEDEERSEEQSLDLLEKYTQFQAVLEENIDRLSPGTREDFEEWLKDNG